MPIFPPAFSSVSAEPATAARGLKVRGMLAFALGAVLITGRWPLSLRFKQERLPEHDQQLREFLGDMQSLAKSLPAGEFRAVGYWNDPARNVRFSHDQSLRLSLTQYACAPFAIERTLERSWIIADQDNLAAVPPWVDHGWTLHASFASGPKVYRRISAPR